MDTVAPPGTGLDRTRLAELLRRERAAFAAGHPRSADANGRADSLFGRVPMTWMNKASGGFPLYLAAARGARVTDIDGHSLTDFSPRRHRCHGRAFTAAGTAGHPAAHG